MGITNVLALFSGVALFLFGMTLMSDGLKKVAGNSLEIVLYKLSSNIFKGILFGAGMTAAIQSSSATSVMVVGFVNSKMMKLKQAIGIIMGAIIGTSITGWVISLSSLEGSSGIFELLSTDSLTAIVAIVGIYLRMFCKKTKQKDLGNILMGFAVLMFGMKQMSGSVSGLRNSELFINTLTSFTNPVVGILVGALFTAVIQSASAAVGILQALSTTGAITISNGLPMLLGIGIGAALPVLFSALGASRDGKRAALSYLLIGIAGAIIISILFYGVNLVMPLPGIYDSINTFDIALINTIYRIIFIALLIPFVSVFEKLTGLIVKEEKAEEETWEEDRLEERFISHPALAIEQVRLTLKSMTNFVSDNIDNSCSLIFGYDENKMNSVEKKEEIVDKYTDKLGSYMVKLTKNELTTSQNSELSVYLHAIGDLERMSDHTMNISKKVKSFYESKQTFTEDASNELKALTSAVQDLIAITMNSFRTDETDMIYSIRPLNNIINDICKKMRSNHIKRLKDGMCTIEHGIVFNDIINDLQRIANHCSNIAISMIELENENLSLHNYEDKLTEDQKVDYYNLLNSYKEQYGIK